MYDWALEGLSYRIISCLYLSLFVYSCLTETDTRLWFTMARPMSSFYLFMLIIRAMAVRN